MDPFHLTYPPSWLYFAQMGKEKHLKGILSSFMDTFDLTNPPSSLYFACILASFMDPFYLINPPSCLCIAEMGKEKQPLRTIQAIAPNQNQTVGLAYFQHTILSWSDSQQR
ncbi:hypothetical protein GOP47_0015313 [Adiantum capillus-veneris]|uniref:Uncharacterized protein n=1 Tax=Adiantum capillus-veneris TaxID=13818 RepID=A0A9D4UK68_ADICA|nr:hypothetical protein GOP47_0015313 [Adiantum capillus-veneris]